MCESNSFTLIIGWILGILPSIVGFFISYRSNWRNIITKEFSVNISFDYLRGSENLNEIAIKCDIVCTNGEELKINYIYIELPDNVKGNSPPSATLGEGLFGTRGRYYSSVTPFVFKHFYSTVISFNNEKDDRIFKEIEAKNIKKLILIVNTSKYGNVNSNAINLINLI